MTTAETLRQLAQRAEYQAARLKKDRPFGVMEAEMQARAHAALLEGAQAWELVRDLARSDGADAASLMARAKALIG